MVPRGCLDSRGKMVADLDLLAVLELLGIANPKWEYLGSLRASSGACSQWRRSFYQSIDYLSPKASMVFAEVSMFQLHATPEELRDHAKTKTSRKMPLVHFICLLEVA
jgi:hypothetical protein